MNRTSLPHLVTLLLLCLPSTVQAEPVSLHLLGRSQVGQYHLDPSVRETQWLTSKKKIGVGHFRS